MNHGLAGTASKSPKNALTWGTTLHQIRYRQRALQHSTRHKGTRQPLFKEGLTQQNNKRHHRQIRMEGFSAPLRKKLVIVGDGACGKTSLLM
jgi:hypothetical protein